MFVDGFLREKTTYSARFEEGVGRVCKMLLLLFFNANFESILNRDLNCYDRYDICVSIF